LSNVNWRPETQEEETEMMKHLDPEEREELEAFNEMLSDPGFVPQQMDPDQIAYWKQIAENTLVLSESVTAPLTANDMSALRVRAAEEGLTPEALAGSLLHKALKGLSR
jgi:predicted DNA binding CopG/RHH family protein